MGLGGSLLLPDPHWGLWPLPFVAATVSTQQRWLSFLLVGVVAGAVSGLEWQHQRLPSECERTEARVWGRIISLPRSDSLEADRVRVSALLRVRRIDPGVCSTPARIRLQHFISAEARSPLRLDQEVALTVLLRPVPSQWSPGSLPDQAYWAASGVSALATVKTIDWIEEGSSVWARLRLSLIDQLELWRHKGVDSSLLRALLLGDQRPLDDADWRYFREIGIVHIMVISGLHLGMLAVFCAALSTLPRRLARISYDRGRAMLAPPLIVAATGSYVLIAGAGLPMVRAFVMLAAVQLAQWMGWRSGGQRGLLLALCAIVLAHPAALLGSSFWMSAAATWILIAQPNNRSLPWGLVWIQCQLVLLMAPLSLFWFGETSGVGFISNLLVVPVISMVVLPLGLLGLVLNGWFPNVAGWLWWVATWVWEGLQPILLWLHTSFVDLAFFTAYLGLLGVVLGVLAMGCWLRSNKPLACALLLSVPLLRIEWGKPDWDAQLTALDVGQGLSLVFRTEDKTLVYDTGGGHPDGFNQARKVVLPFLQYQGIDVLDMLMVSHGDLDHSAGLRAIQTHTKILRHLGFGGDPCRNGEAWRWGQIELRVLNGPGQGEEDSNDSSCGLLITGSGGRVLLTGDISGAREREWVRFWRQTLGADLLVVSHHGSRSSSEYAFLKWVRPTDALISAGRANAFGHPHFETLERLQAAGISSLWHTAEQGAVTISWYADRPLRIEPMRTLWTPYWLRLP